MFFYRWKDENGDLVVDENGVYVLLIWNQSVTPNANNLPLGLL